MEAVRNLMRWFSISDYELTVSDFNDNILLCNFPIDIFTIIIRHLSFIDVIHLMKTCSALHSLLSHNDLWAILLQKYFPIAHHKINNTTNYDRFKKLWIAQCSLKGYTTNPEWRLHNHYTRYFLHYFE